MTGFEIQNAYSIAAIDIRRAANDTYAAMHVFANLIRAEKLPDDPPVRFWEYRDNFRNIPENVDVHKWLVSGDGTDVVIAAGTLVIVRDGNNQHVAEANIAVLPEFRRKGIGRTLLGRIADVARKQRRTVLTWETSEAVSSGDLFLERLGAERALESHLNQLDVADLDAAVLASWVDAFLPLTSEFEIEVVQGPYAEEDIVNISALFNAATESTPRGSLKQNPHVFTPTQLREHEHHTLIGGTERWTVFIRHLPTGAYVGLTEVAWRPPQPELLEQRSTAVYPDFRRRGLARVLKATLLTRILAKHPEIKFVRTDNADANAPMLAVNSTLGFKPFKTLTTWQIETDKIFEYLRCTIAT